jgi:hypothetical protein
MQHVSAVLWFCVLNATRGGSACNSGLEVCPAHTFSAAHITQLSNRTRLDVFGMSLAAGVPAEYQGGGCGHQSGGSAAAGAVRHALEPRAQQAGAADCNSFILNSKPKLRLVLAPATGCTHAGGRVY